MAVRRNSILTRASGESARRSLRYDAKILSPDFGSSLADMSRQSGGMRRQGHISLACQGKARRGTNLFHENGLKISCDYGVSQQGVRYREYKIRSRHNLEQ